MKICAPRKCRSEEIVLEARVYHPQFHDGLQFLSNDRFAAICPQFGCRHAEQNGERDFFRHNMERISETNVHLQWNNGFPNLRLQFDANPGIFFLRANILSLDAVGIKFNSIALNLRPAKFTKDGSRPLLCWFARTRVNPVSRVTR